MAGFLSSILEIANVFISLFVLIYAFSFLKQTADVKDRRPWVFLFFAAFVFFIFEVVGLLNLFSISEIPALMSFLESIFIALILFVFIFQYDLILKSDLILITRKIAKEEEELETKVEALDAKVNQKKKKKTTPSKSKKKK